MRRTAPNLATVQLHEDCPTNLNQTVWTHANISMREMQILLNQSHQRPSNNPGPSGQPIVSCFLLNLNSVPLQHNILLFIDCTFNNIYLFFRISCVMKK